MGKHKPLSILKRAPEQPKKRPAAQSNDQGGPQKRHKPSPAAKGDVTGSSLSSLVRKQPRKAHRPPSEAARTAGAWEAVSVVDRQAARAVQQLLRADASGRGGASIKSLTLAPAMEAKKATYAVTCQTLKLLPVLKQLLEGWPLLQQHRDMQPETAYVLVYEVLFGEGLRRRGPAEKAVWAAREALRQLLEDMKTAAGLCPYETHLCLPCQRS